MTTQGSQSLTLGLTLVAATQLVSAALRRTGNAGDAETRRFLTLTGDSLKLPVHRFDLSARAVETT